MDYQTQEKLKAIYDAKGYIVLEDLERAFDTDNRSYSMRMLKQLKEQGYLERIPETSCPIKFRLQDPYAVEYLEVLQTC